MAVFWCVGRSSVQGREHVSEGQGLWVTIVQRDGQVEGARLPVWDLMGVVSPQAKICERVVEEWGAKGPVLKYFGS